jgi:two-component system, LytTR family, sensor histidine kinase AlgZ
MQTFIQRYRVFLLHASFWCVYMSFFVYSITSFRHRETELGVAFLQAGVQVAFHMIVAYLNYFIFLPRFLERQKLGRYLLEFSIPFIVIIFIRIHLQRYMIDGYTNKEHYFYSTLYTVQAVATTLFIVIFVAMLRFAKDWFEFESKKKEVENEKLTAELNFLKAQINPHFLFNTLNNLYYLAFTKSPNTTEVIEKLSQMMRYMMYDSNYPQVPLNKEIEYMQNYVALERLRLNNTIPIQFDVFGNTAEVRIAPLIFITFLENAFKHGVSNANPKSWVNVSIKVSGKTCTYRVENSKIPAVKNGEKSGIGLQNVRRRLELSYPGEYELQMNDLPDRFAMQLNLTLT